MPEGRSGNMAKFHGFRSCVTCKVNCTPGNFVDFKSKRYCTACWIGEHNPEHPELELIRQQVIDSVEEWKCAKWSREEGPLPDGPKPARD
ncbi:MAG: hypothetical protein NZ732_05760 [Candidatus Poseidoniales archaeon]|nr:hypothetical protein [Candidatus Poseidoniales archaeon]